MASKKKSTSEDEFGNKIPVKTGSKTMRTIRSSGVDSTRGSRAGSSLRARGIEKGNTAGRVGSKTMTTARSSGAESKRSSKLNTPPQSIRAAGAKSKARAAASTAATRTARSSGAESKVRTRGAMTGRTARASGAERMGITGARSGSSLRARGIETGGIKKAAPKASSYPQSVRAAGAKAAANKNSTSSFRSNRFGKGVRGGSAQVTPRSNQSMRAYEYKKKNPGKY
jgi:hypothetical protein